MPVATCGAGIAYPVGAPAFTPHHLVFSEVRIARYYIFCVMFSRSLFVLFLLAILFVCQSIYDFSLTLWNFQTSLRVSANEQLFVVRGHWLLGAFFSFKPIKIVVIPIS